MNAKGQRKMYIYTFNFQNEKPLRPLEEAIELRHKVILVVSIDETLPTVVYKPTGNIGSKYSICSVIFLQASARKMVRMVRAQTKACQPAYLQRRHALPLAVLCAPSTTTSACPHPSPFPKSSESGLSFGRTEY